MLRPDPKPLTLILGSLIFPHRNRAYKAFDPRRRYRPTLNRALTLGVSLLLTSLAALMLYIRLFLNDVPPEKQTGSRTEFEQLSRQPVDEVAMPPANRPVAQPTLFQTRPVVAHSPKSRSVATIIELAPAVTGHETDQVKALDDVVDVPKVPEATPGPIVCYVAPEPDDVFVAGQQPQHLSQDVFTVVEKAPEFPGGFQALRAYMVAHVQYPPEARKARVQGRVLISFIVERDSSLTDVQVRQGIGFGCDEEARRVVRQMPKWIPGSQSGRSLRVRYTLPVLFGMKYPAAYPRRE